MTRYQEALLDELIEHAQQTAVRSTTASHVGRARSGLVRLGLGRRGPGLARRRVIRTAAVAAAAAVAAVVVLTGPFTAAPAYAVVKHPDGTVSLSFRELADPGAATHDLRAAGLRAQVVRLGRPGTCAAGSGTPWQQPARPQEGRGTITVFSPRTDASMDQVPGYITNVFSNGVTFAPLAVPDGTTVFVMEYTAASGGVVVGFGLVRSPAPTCWAADPALG